MIDKDSAYKEILERLREIKAANGGEKPAPIPLIDPTANVLKHVEGAVGRINDLAGRDNEHAREVRRLEERHEDQIARLNEKLATAETDRINAITLAESRRVDSAIANGTAAVALASEKSATQAATLAKQVADTAIAMANQTSTLRDSIEKRLGLVEQNQYIGGGKSAGLNAGWIYLIGGVGLIGGIVGLFFALSKGGNP